MKKKDANPSRPPSTVDPEQLNHSELVELARLCDSSAHRGLSREQLLAVACLSAPPLPLRTIDKKRLQILRFIDTHWEQVSYQINCPAKSRDPRACFTCSDLQATACATDNKDVLNEKD
jgi:hypothetical protein